MAQPVASEIDRFVGQRIQQKRREKGYSAERLSEYVDISQPQLSRYERGANKINVAHLVAIATFLKTPISYFFEDCMSGFDWNSDEADRYWMDLTQRQKTLLVELLKEIKK
ncbi:XRE family transcriptional regulator [Muribacter muris]|uniref:XRE family transcriptional regulator n=1 Tax=Muribacter muris TaxID=67855 RepID=A0A4Y9K2F2_9PAST|nr:helix-turn-helix transcriptional regulator [Muribacter muris]MBF0784937.1 helix-turn-helix transcriptional regulator [Muribacter muris]MBF0827245.1 helix-turn-helix transcriptional regulator [Muribacter muris]TFV10856.1 XRE family transcriptional regulator [Muribacter muris]